MYKISLIIFLSSILFGTGCSAHTDKEASYWFDEGLRNYAAGNYVESAEDYKKVLKLKPELPEAHYNLGLDYVFLKMHKEAAASLEKAFELNPNFDNAAEAYYQLGSQYIILEMYEKSAKNFKKLILLRPNDASGYYSLGVAYQNLKMYDLSSKAIEQAIKIKPDDPCFYQALAFSYRLMGKNKESRDTYIQYLKFEPNDAFARYELLKVYAQMGDEESFSKELEVLKKLDSKRAEQLIKEVKKAIEKRDSVR